jgi:hypothetical protein
LDQKPSPIGLATNEQETPQAHTVDYHPRKVFTKVGIRPRSHLNRILPVTRGPSSRSVSMP